MKKVGLDAEMTGGKLRLIKGMGSNEQHNERIWRRLLLVLAGHETTSGATKQRRGKTYL